METRKMNITEAYPHLQIIADIYGLKLNRAKEFKLARTILINLYCRELC